MRARSDQPLVSIIVPVYNQERYLARCLDSILNQTYENMELIVVDDCSTDASAEIIQRYAALDSRVKPIHSPENCGTCVSRNRGIDAAVGAYIGFVDDDDTVSPEMFGALVDALIDHQADVAVCGCTAFDESGNQVYAIGWNDQTECMDRDEAMYHLHVDAGDGRHFHTTQWNKLYTRAIIGDTRVDPECGGSEDYWFSHQILLKANRVVRISGLYYHVNLRTGSISRSPLSERSIYALEAHRRIIVSLRETYPDLVKPVLIRYLLAVSDASLRGVGSKRISHRAARTCIRFHASLIRKTILESNDPDLKTKFRQHFIDLYLPGLHNIIAPVYNRLYHAVNSGDQNE